MHSNSTATPSAVQSVWPSFAGGIVAAAGVSLHRLPLLGRRQGIYVYQSNYVQSPQLWQVPFWPATRTERLCSRPICKDIESKPVCNSRNNSLSLLKHWVKYLAAWKCKPLSSTSCLNILVGHMLGYSSHSTEAKISCLLHTSYFFQ